MAPFAERMRVLVADDHPAVRQNLSLLLAGEPDLDVVGAAADGYEALALARELRPDVLVLDHEMPGPPRLEVARELLAEGGGLRVVLFTLDTTVSAAARDVGVTACLAKDAPVSLLLDAVRASGVYLLAGGPAARARGERLSLGPSKPGWRVLVAEDDPSIREILVEALADAGHEAVAAANGEEALRECARRDPDVVLLDLMMPVMGGRQFLAAYRRRAGARAQVIALSALPQARDIAAELGCAAGFAKPFALDEVLSTVERLGAAPPQPTA